jgi:hypothetical protein
MKVARFTLVTRDFGTILVMRPYPKDGDAWGDLAPLRDTPWGKLLPIVSGPVLSHALHGYHSPLMQELGAHPHHLSKRIPKGYRRCRMYDNCVMAHAQCHPNPKMPDCFSPPGVGNDALLAAATVAQAWAEGRYVLIVEGDEFSF